MPSVFHYTSINFVSEPQPEDTQIKIYDKFGTLQHVVDPRIAFFMVQESALQINIKNQNDIYLDFASNDEAKIAILKINAVKQTILENSISKSEYINRVPTAIDNNIAIFDDKGGVKDIGYKIDDNELSNLSIWTSQKIYGYITGVTGGLWIQDPTNNYIYNLVDDVGINQNLFVTGDTTIDGDLIVGGQNILNIIEDASVWQRDPSGFLYTKTSGDSIFIQGDLNVTGNTLLSFLTLNSGVTVYGISNNSGLTDRTEYIVTEYAIKNYVDSRVLSQSSATTIGQAEDGDYSDGLFTDFTPETPTGTAVDRFNEVLKALSPSPAPALSDWDATTTSVSGKLSFGASNTIVGYTNVPTVDVNGSWTKSGKNLGISNTTGTITGTLNYQVAATTPPDKPYHDDSFGDGEKGVLNFYLNGLIIDTLSLSGTTGATSSTNLSVSQLYNAKFDSDSELSVFKHRTGTYTINKSTLNNGYNYIEVKHIFGVTTRSLTKFEIVIDSDVTTTTFSSPSLHTLSMTGSKYISGVRYHTAGTASYDITISNAYRNTYSASASAISFTGTNGTISSQSIPNCTTETDNIVLTNKIFTIDASRLLNQSISTITTVLRTLQGTQTSTSSTISGILMDNVAEGSSVGALETFNGESYRLKTNNYDTYGVIGSNDWDETESLSLNGGLQCYGGNLVYPTINFSTITNGYGGNPDYSGLYGNRTYYRYFRQTSPTTALFKLKISGSGLSFVAAGTSLTTSTAHCWIKLPGLSSQETGWLDVTQNFSTGSWNDNDGCKNQTDSFVLGTECLLTVGTKNTAYSDGYVIVKIELGSLSTGTISQIDFSWTN